MSNGSTTAEKAKWLAMRVTPRKLTAAELHQRAVTRRDAKRHAEKIGLDTLKATKEGDRDRRNKARQHLHALYLHGLERNRVLGIDPVYRGVCDRGSPMHKAWLKEARAFDRQSAA